MNIANNALPYVKTSAHVKQISLLVKTGKGSEFWVRYAIRIHE